MKHLNWITGPLLLIGFSFSIMSCEDIFLENLEYKVKVAGYSVGDIGPAGGIIFFIE